MSNRRTSKWARPVTPKPVNRAEAVVERAPERVIPEPTSVHHHYHPPSRPEPRKVPEPKEVYRPEPTGDERDSGGPYKTVVSAMSSDEIFESMAPNVAPVKVAVKAAPVYVEESVEFKEPVKVAPVEVINPMNIFLDFLTASNALTTWSNFFQSGDYAGDADAFNADTNPTDYICDVIPEVNNVYSDKSVDWLAIDVAWDGLVTELNLSGAWLNGDFN